MTPLLQLFVGRISVLRLGWVTRLCLAGFCLSAVSAPASGLRAETYQVGPSRRLQSISEVPWERLKAGDQILIDWQREPYRDKWVICAEGTEERPILVSGIPNEDGRLPVITGDQAQTRQELDFWNEDRGVIKVGGASHAPRVTPRHIIIENLDLRSARPAYSFQGRRGSSSYRRDAAAIYVEDGVSITIRRCRLSDSGNGLFTNGQRILVEHCQIEGNGIAGSFAEHNVYSAADGITYQFNQFGNLRAACAGNNLKDRSAGLIVRYNWIEGGSRQLDLVDAEDHGGRLVNRSSYRETFVYGNVFEEGKNHFRNEIVHYGGDSGNDAWYRKGTLHFYHNTVISRREGLTVLFRLSSEDEKAELSNNIFFAANPLGRLALSHGRGTFCLHRNWLSRGWVKTSRTLFWGDLSEVNTIEGRAPDFVDWKKRDYRLSGARAERWVSEPLESLVSARYPLLFLGERSGDWRSKGKDQKPPIGAFSVQFPDLQ